MLTGARILGAAASSSSRTFFTNLYVLSTKSAVPILPAALILILKKIVTVSVRERIEYEEGNRERGREREIDREREREREGDGEREVINYQDTLSLIYLTFHCRTLDP